MENIEDLFGLLFHHVQNLYSAEDQQLQALPAMIKRANHNSLKNALSHHLALTTEHRERLKKIPALINKKITAAKSSSEITGIELIPKNINTEFVCKGMQGLIDEANQLLEVGLDKDVTDAAIIAAVQKIEHYEICTYG